MNNGLNLNAGKEAAKKTDQTTGKYVLKDLDATAEVFELISISTTGVKSAMSIRLRSTYNGAIYTADNFWKIRPAFPNEAQANARQGSGPFNQFWANNACQYY